jgi:hypothetical protein
LSRRCDLPTFPKAIPIRVSADRAAQESAQAAQSANDMTNEKLDRMFKRSIQK